MRDSICGCASPQLNAHGLRDALGMTIRSVVFIVHPNPLDINHRLLISTMGTHSQNLVTCLMLRDARQAVHFPK